MRTKCLSQWSVWCLGLFLSLQVQAVVSWQPTTQPNFNDSIVDVYADPTTRTTLYAIGGSDPAGATVYQSTNGGANWAAQKTGLVDSSGSGLFNQGTLLVDTQSRLFLTSDAGEILRSTNQGVTWSNISPPNQTTGNSIAVSGSVLYAYLFNSSSVYRSVNGGTNWSLLQPVDTQGNPLSVIAVADNAAAIYVGTFGSGIYRSTDNGVNWNAFNAGLGQVVNTSINFPVIDDIQVDSAGVLYVAAESNPMAGTAGGLFSFDGANWVSMGSTVLVDSNNVPLDIFSVFISPTSTTGSLSMAVGTDAGIFISTDSGISWAEMNTGTWFATFAGAYVSSSVLVVGTDNGVFFSLNSGQSFSFGANRGLKTFTQSETTFLTRDPTNDARWYTVLVDSKTNIRHGLFKTDGITVWNPINHGLTDKLGAVGSMGDEISITVDSANNPTLYMAAGFDGVWKSTNTGGTWTEISSGLTGSSGFIVQATQVVVDPSSAAATGGSQTLYAATAFDGVFRSTNGGNVWSAINTGLTNNFSGIPTVNAIAIDPTNSSVLFAATNDGVFKGINSNGTVNWTAMNTGLPLNNSFQAIQSILIDLQNNQTLYVASFSAVHESVNGGQSWTDISTGLNINPSTTGDVITSLAMDPQNTASLYLTTQGVFGTNINSPPTNGNVWSRLGSAQWTTVNSGLLDQATQTRPSIFSIGVGNQAVNGPKLVLSTNRGVFKGTATTTTAALAGTITDATNGSFGTVQASIAILSDANGNLLQTATANNGSYMFTGLFDGTYNLEAVLDTTGTLIASGIAGFDPSNHPLAEYPNNPVTISNGQITDVNSTFVSSADITVSHLTQAVLGIITDNTAANTGQLLVEISTDPAFTTIVDFVFVGLGGSSYAIVKPGIALNTSVYARACVDADSNALCDANENSAAFAGNPFVFTAVGQQISNVNITLTTNTITNQTINFTTQPPSSGPINGSVTLNATATSGLPVSFTPNSTGVCSITGNSVLLTAVGACTIQANQAGGVNAGVTYAAAPTVVISIQVNKLTQTITFNPPGSGVSGTTINLSAASDAPLSVSFSVLSAPTVCSQDPVNPAILHLVGPGACQVVAFNNGNTTYTLAEVIRTITIPNSGSTSTTLTGTITDNSGVTGQRIFAILSPASLAQASLITEVINGQFTFSNLPDGQYSSLSAVVDTTGNIIAMGALGQNLLDPSGSFMGTVSVANGVVAATDLQGSTISQPSIIIQPLGNTLTGNITNQTRNNLNLLLVELSTDDFSSIQLSQSVSSGGGLYAFTALTINQPTQYQIRACVDSNSSFTCDNSELIGIYPNNPITHGGGGQSVTGINITLHAAPVPVVTPPANISVDATGLKTFVDLGQGRALDYLGAVLSVIPSDSGPFAPGIYTITWRATDKDGFVGVSSSAQQVTVRPRVSIGIDQVTAEGAAVTVPVFLNGLFPNDVSVPFVVTGSATNPADHNLANGTVVITAGSQQGAITFTIAQDNITEFDETVIVTLGSPTNAVQGLRTSQTTTIREVNLAPKIRLSVDQNTVQSRVVSKADGNVTLTATVQDANPNDTHRYDWSLTDNSLVDIDANPTNASFVFDPSNLAIGTYRVQLDVTDSGTPAQATTAVMVLRVIATRPNLLSTEDTDGDGIPDATEGDGDSDGDGLRDFEDAQNAANVLQTALGGQASVLETLPGLHLRLGEVAFALSKTGAELSLSDVLVDNQTHIGGVFDFVIDGLQKGASATLVIPLGSSIPNNPVYRVLMPTGWQNFVEDAQNTLGSAAGTQGVCPPPGDTAYTAGLLPGNRCVELTIEDGGANDEDGVADGTVTDPSGVAITSSAAAVPSSSGGGGGSLQIIELTLLALFGMLFAYSGTRRRSLYS